MAETTAITEPPLDELMMAMDVVDTLRHGEALVEHELGDQARRARLIERLKEIYRSQGIEVPERILAEGVDALEQDRFVYKPPPGGWQVALARLYARRATIGKRLAIGFVALALVGGGWYGFIELPRQRAVETERVELTTTIPGRLAELERSIVAEAEDPQIDVAAARVAADGRAAVEAGNAAGARQAVAELESRLAELRLEFEVRIVSRPDEPSGVTRIPDVNAAVENTYLVVEAIAPDGTVVPRPIRSEEDASVRTVTMWGVRVPEEVFERVRLDKLDDGIVQDSLVGAKRRGRLDLEWSVPVSGGMVTDW